MFVFSGWLTCTFFLRTLGRGRGDQGVLGRVAWASSFLRTAESMAQHSTPFPGAGHSSRRAVLPLLAGETQASACGVVVCCAVCCVAGIAGGVVMAFHTPTSHWGGALDRCTTGWFGLVEGQRLTN
jgi:hypothetical protein